MVRPRARAICIALVVFGCDDGGDSSPVVDAALADMAAADMPIIDTGASEPEPTPQPEPAPQPEGEPGPDLAMTAADFDCMLDWPAVRRFRITNKLGMLDDALAVANSADGGIYPPGTVIQLVPQEAMVKRARGWNPTTNDWEFFFLDIDGEGAVSIRTRGAEETVNAFGGNCFECHAKAAPQWDFVCEQDRGCDPLPFSAEVIMGIQENDPRCR